MTISSRRLRAWALSCGILLFYSALAVALFHQGWTRPSTQIIGYCCDSLIAISYLQSTGVALLHGHQPFITAYLNAPHGVNAMWQASSSISLGIFATPFESLLGPVAAYNLFATLAVSLSGWSAYLVIRRFVPGYLGPFIGGLIFGFSSFMTVQSIAGHLDLTFIALIPPALGLVTCLVLGRTRSPVRAGIALGVLLVAQLLINQEILLDLVVAGVVLACALAVAFRTEVARAWRTLVVGTCAAGATFLVVGGWPLWAVVFGPLRPMSLNVIPSIPSDLMSFIAPSPIINVDPIWVRTFDSGWFPDNVDQSSAYIGVAMIAVTVAAVVALRRNRAVIVAAVWALIMAILSMGPHLRVADHVTGVSFPGLCSIACHSSVSR